MEKSLFHYQVAITMTEAIAFSPTKILANSDQEDLRKIARTYTSHEPRLI